MTVDDEMVGEAAATDAMLMGKEVDEQTLHARQVVEQVQQMVASDPEAAVAILKRWIEMNQD